MNKPKYSIIVPVYNVDRYLRQCIESVLAQTFDDFELILVDDGSKDGCANICDRYGLEDSRVRVIHQANAGVSVARNVGIDVARGEYLMFVDGDDWIEREWLAVLDAQSNDNSDIIMVGITQDYEDEGGNVLYSEIKGVPVVKHIQSQQLSSEIGYLIKTTNMESSCLKMYRTSFIKNNNIRFVSDMIVFEDFYFVLSCMSLKPILTLLPFIGYHYRVSLNYNPVVRRGFRDLYPSIHKLFVMLDKVISDIRLTGWSLEIVLRTMTDKISVVLAQSVYAKNNKQRLMPFKQISNDEILSKHQAKVLLYAGGRYRLIHKMMSAKLYYFAYLFYRYV